MAQTVMLWTVWSVSNQNPSSEPSGPHDPTMESTLLCWVNTGVVGESRKYLGNAHLHLHRSNS